MRAKAKSNEGRWKSMKNYKIFSTSWNVQAKLFFEHSTLHGVRYIAEDGRPFLERFMWFACVAIGAVATAVIIVSLWEKFQTNPTITGLDTDFHNWDVPFPAITLCQEVPGNLSRIEEYLHNITLPPGVTQETATNFLIQLTQLNYNSLKKLADGEKDGSFIPLDVDLKDLAFGLMNRCEEIFNECEFKSYPYNCCEGFFPVFTERGFCYAFNSRHYERKLPRSDKILPEFKMNYIKETDIKWALNFSVKNDRIKMPIYILNSDEQASLDAEPQYIWDFKVNKISFSVKETYTTNDTRQLTIRQRHCIFSDELKLKVDHIYTYTACTRECRMKNAMKKCNCVPHFYPDVGYFRHCKLEDFSCISENLEDIKAADGCSCQLSCFNTVYEVEKLNEMADIAPNSLEAQFVSWPMVRYKREVLFGWVDLLVAFGGIAGLFLGFSLLSGVEIVYYFTLRALCMVFREPEELERIQLEKASKPPQDYDLSLVPYFITKPYPGNGLQEIAKMRYKRKILQRTKLPRSHLRRHVKRVEPYLPPFGIEFMN